MAQARIAFELVASQWGAPADAVEAAYNDVVARYGEPHRRYHTLEHIDEVLARVNGTEVELAAWYHDIIYDTTASDSEARSSAYAGEVLARLGAPDDVIAEVQRLILLTAGHAAADDDDVNGSMLIRADLSILSSEPSRYDRYARDVRAEYVQFDDESWRAGRTAALQSLLAIALDERARSNIARELAGLAMPQA
jgi:predicted metal-dependent HD superfamily phosphohydrolase